MSKSHSWLIQRWRLVLVGLALAMLLAAATRWAIRDFRKPPVWQEFLATHAVDVGPPDPEKPYSTAVQAQRLRLEQVLLRREWAEAEVREVTAALAAAPLDYVVTPETTHDEAYDRRCLSDWAASVVQRRLASGAPIEPQFREQLVQAFLLRSYAVDPLVRHGMANALCASGLIYEDDRVRERMEALASDPDPMVALNAKRKMRWAEAERHEYEAYQRKLGGLD